MTVKYKHLTIEERFLIEKMIKERKSISYISRLINRAKSCISNEISRNRGRGRYKHIKAIERYKRKQKLKKKKCNAVVKNSVARKRIDRMLAKNLSPEYISRKIFAHRKSVQISPKSIRKYRENYYKH